MHIISASRDLLQPLLLASTNSSYNDEIFIFAIYPLQLVLHRSHCSIQPTTRDLSTKYEYFRTSPVRRLFLWRSLFVWRVTQSHDSSLEWSQEHATVLESIQAEAANGRNGSGGSNWSDSLSTVTIRSMAAQSCEQPPLIRRLPTATLTVGKVKALLARHFGLDWDLQELSLQNNASESIPTALDQDDETLEYFGVADGATIFMHEVDVRARQEEVRKRQQEQEDKMRQQEKEVQDYMQIQKKLAGA